MYTVPHKYAVCQTITIVVIHELTNVMFYEKVVKHNIIIWLTNYNYLLLPARKCKQREIFEKESKLKYLMMLSGFFIFMI